MENGIARKSLSQFNQMKWQKIHRQYNNESRKFICYIFLFRLIMPIGYYINLFLFNLNVICVSSVSGSTSNQWHFSMMLRRNTICGNFYGSKRHLSMVHLCVELQSKGVINWYANLRKRWKSAICSRQFREESMQLCQLLPHFGVIVLVFASCQFFMTFSRSATLQDIAIAASS